jgi:hypothetical protein
MEFIDGGVLVRSSDLAGRQLCEGQANDGTKRFCQSDEQRSGILA